MRRSLSLRSRRFLPLSVVLLVVFCANPAHAITYSWNVGDGWFTSAASWSPLGVPGRLDTALFALPGGHNVSFGSSVLNAHAIVRDGDYTFALGGQTYLLMYTPSVVVGDTASLSGALTLSGGTVSGADGIVGDVAGSTGTVTVGTLGQGAAWDNAMHLYIGNEGTGNLFVQNGGSVSNGKGYLGFQSAGIGTATVEGAASTWTNWDNLYVGYDGAGTLTVQSGASISNVSGVLGRSIGSQGTATVNDATWTNSVDLHVGNEGTGDLFVQNGGSVWNIDGYVGGQPNGLGTATVEGTGSTWTNSGDLYVGNYGVGTLTVQSGGSVSNVLGYLGYWGGSQGTVTVDGIGSLWESSGSLYVGGSSTAPGGTGSVTIRNDGQVSVGGTLKLWPDGTVGLEGGVLETYAFDARDGAFNWTGGTLRGTGSFGIGSAELFGDALSVGAACTLEVTNTLNVTGPAGALTVDGTATVGSLSGGGTVTVQSGGSVSSPSAILGRFSGSQGTVTVNNATSTNSGDLYVGYDGVGTLTVQTGGSVSNGQAYVGYWSGSQGTVTVNDATWTNSGDLHVGNYGVGTLTVQSGGNVSNTVGYLGSDFGSQGTATLTGTGSTWTNSGDLYVGYWGAGDLTVQSGGSVSNTRGYVGATILVGAPGSVTVRGTGSTWTNSGALFVGLSGVGTLTVQSGGSVSNAAGYLGYSWGSQGTATVDGVGSLWESSGSLYVGGSDADSGGTGSVTIRNDGQVTVGGTLKLWGGGTVVLEGGMLEVANTLNVTGPGGTLRVEGGTVQAVELAVGAGGAAELHGGTATLGSLSSAGTLNFQGGTLNLTGPGGLVIATGQPLGSSLTLTSSHTLNVTNAMQVAPEGTFNLGPGAGFTTGSMSNAGLTSVLVPAIDFGSGLTNTGNLFLVGTTVDGTVYTPTGSTVTVLNTVTFNDLVSGAGSFWGPGTVVFNGGYSPGDSAGVGSFEGNVGFRPNASLMIELGGTQPDQFDRLSVGGNVALDGTLDLTLIDGFVPAYGDRFDIIVCAARSGVFDQIAGLAVGPDMSLAVLYAAGRVDVEAVLPGDANLDGVVNVGDLGILGAHYGGAGKSWAQADFNGDGQVNVGDLGVLGAHYGQAVPPGGTVPEPATLALLGVGGVLLLKHRRRPRPRRKEKSIQG